MRALPIVCYCIVIGWLYLPWSGAGGMSGGYVYGGALLLYYVRIVWILWGVSGGWSTLLRPKEGVRSYTHAPRTIDRYPTYLV